MPPKPEPKIEKETFISPLKQIRTFQGDVTEALQRQQESLVSIQRAEQSRRGTIQSMPSDSSKEGSAGKKSFLFLLVGSFVLFALGSVGAWYAYSNFIKKTTTSIVEGPANKFFSTNSETTVDLTELSRQALITALTGAKLEVPSGDMKHIVVRKSDPTGTYSMLAADEFLATLKSRAPGSLARAFDSLFMFGAYGQSTFIIIKLASFESAFGGMLAWEKDMALDIGPLLSTSLSLQNVPFDAKFRDITDKNKDIRALFVDDRPVLLYSFIDNNLLIITDDIETIRAVIERITREKLSR